MSLLRVARRLCHWGPLLALSVIFIISTMAMLCSIVQWPPNISTAGLINLLVLCLWAVLIVYMFMRGLISGPGFVPLGWVPDNVMDSQFLQHCHVCQSFKAPRSHHCRKCNRCVMKMDHHCPWINTCCGHKNHAYFVSFLFFAPIGCGHGAIVIGYFMFRAVLKYHQQFDIYGQQPFHSYGLYLFCASMFAFGLAVGVMLTVGYLCVYQMYCILINMTGIEQWIVDKAEGRHRPMEQPFVYPYDVGPWKNFCQVFTLSLKPAGDGFQWPVVHGCDQFTLTKEQLSQKEEKKSRTVEFENVEEYSGSWCPVSKGCRVVFSFPLTDEPRIKLNRGDRVLVTRGRKHWLYGDKQLSEQEQKQGIRIRGWFPRRCCKKVLIDVNEDIAMSKFLKGD